MIELLLAGLITSGTPDSLPQAQPTAVSVSPDPDTPTRLEDVQVIGRSLENLVRGFVDDVAAPNPRRNLARWNAPVCVGMTSAHLGAETTQYIVDRVSTVAEDVGLRTGAPGCTPNIIVVASDDPNQTAAAMIDRRRSVFRPGGGGIERGGAALRAFRNSDQAVRWWALSMPTDAFSGARAARLPGDCQEPCTVDPQQGGQSALGFAPIINQMSGGRIGTQIVDDLFRVIVIVDINKVEGFSAQQLADYIAMVSLAQINPEADTSRYASILNLFEEPDYATTLTDWDQAYLSGLYSAQRTQKLAGANRSEIIGTIQRAHRDLRQDRDAQD